MKLIIKLWKQYLHRGTLQLRILLNYVWEWISHEGHILRMHDTPVLAHSCVPRVMKLSMKLLGDWCQRRARLTEPELFHYLSRVMVLDNMYI